MSLKEKNSESNMTRDMSLNDMRCIDSIKGVRENFSKG